MVRFILVLTATVGIFALGHAVGKSDPLAPAAAPARAPGVCLPPQAAEAGWSASFLAGCIERKGRFAGGSQIIHLVAHKGQLYAANGYWMDARNPIYGHDASLSAWGQVLRLAGANEPWTVDLELGPRHLRTELLKSVTFTQDAQGRTLAAPVNLLVAATYNGANGVDAVVRDDAAGAWARTLVIEGDPGRRGEDNSVRAAAVYRDRVTAREQLLISVGVVGIFAGHYDPMVPGRVRWSAVPEFRAAETRVLGMTEANGSLFVSEGKKVYRRIDGEVPAYQLIADMSGDVDVNTDRATFQSIGGIRGLSAIDGPVAGRKSLMFLWAPGKNSQGCIMRLDPRPDGSYVKVREVCLAELISQYLGGTPIPYALGAYSNFLELRAPGSGETYHLIGLEAFIPASPAGRRSLYLVAANQRRDRGGFYGGALYALRDGQGKWRLGEVNGAFQPGKQELVSVYTYAMSPFGGTDRQNIYLGGYDPNNFPSTDTGWVYRAGLKELLGR
jgi:poly(A) polymerase